MSKIKIGIIGVGNCASSLIQGINYYAEKSPEEVIGLMHWRIRGYEPQDIVPVWAVDIDSRKVGKDLSDAIFSPPNCTKKIIDKLPYSDIEVQMGKVLDGFPEHMKEYHEDKRFLLSKEKEPEQGEIIQSIKDSGAEILLNYLPVGSECATKFYANCALESEVGFINCIPVFIASNSEWAGKFEKRKLPIIGDDVKSQIGATIIHRNLADLFSKRGVELDRTYQLNTGGNTDFLNMLERNRLKNKKTSKTEAVQSAGKKRLKPENIHIGPSDYVPWQKDNKIAFIRMEGRIFGDIPIDLELRLSVEDSPNSAGVTIDAIRCAKLALDRKQGGALIAPSAYFMKHPPKQFTDDKACGMVEEFISAPA